LANFLDPPLPPLESCGTFATFVFLLQSGAFLPRGKNSLKKIENIIIIVILK